MSAPIKSGVSGRRSYHESQDHGSSSFRNISTTVSDRGIYSSDDEDGGTSAVYSSLEKDRVEARREQRGQPQFRYLENSPTRSPEQPRKRTFRNPGSDLSAVQSNRPATLARRELDRSPVPNKSQTKSPQLKKKSPDLPLTVESTKSFKPTERNASTRLSCIQLTVIVLFLVIMIGVVSTTLSGTQEKKHRNCSSLDLLKTKFPHQEANMWKALKVGIESVLNGEPPKPSIFLLLHRDDNSTRNILRQIVDAAAACFDTKLKAVKLDSDEFNSEDALRDHGVLIQRYREALQAGGVVFIADLNKIPSQTAPALHFICDNENPMIQNVVIFLSLKSLSDVKKPVQIAEDTLNTIWSSAIDKNTLSAIVTRVTDQVFSLKPE